MTSRADMIETAARALADWDREDGDPRRWRRDLATQVLDVVLPQVSTVEQLEALPIGAKFVDADGAFWRKPALPVKLEKSEGSDQGYWDREDALSFGPLTVVWQPSEVTVQ